jgi:hypothetical protein
VKKKDANKGAKNRRKLIIEKSTSLNRKEEIYYLKEDSDGKNMYSDDEAPPQKGKNDKEASYAEFEFPKEMSKVSNLVNS